MSDLYNQLCNMLIRPTRQTYHAYDLGNPIISTHGKRQDFQILTRNNLKLKCSFYQSINKEKSINYHMPNIIYLHSLNGSRLQFLSYIEPLLKLGFSVSTFDFGGCGLSEGQYVTLGAHEKLDVLSLLKWVYKTYKIQNFIIWGRSMGAVAGIKFYNLLASKRRQQPWTLNIKLLGLILDSPFISLNRLAIQIAKNKIRMPQLLIKMAFYIIQNSIEQKANFKISELELQEQIKHINIPTLIITSKNDTLVNYQHSLNIYNGISSRQKQLMYIDAEHNSNRSLNDMQRIYKFLISKSSSSIKSPVHINSRQIQSIHKSIEKIKAKSLKKQYENEIQSKQKLNRYQSQKNQIHFTKNNNFFRSNVVAPQSKSQIYDVNNNQNLKHARLRQFSHQKIILESYNQQSQVPQISKRFISNNQNQVHSVERQRPKVFFNNQQLFDNSSNRVPVKRQLQQSKQKINNYKNMPSIPQQKQRIKPLCHASSYKNIECLKTVKKIKRLEPQQKNKIKQHQKVNLNISKQQKSRQQKQQNLKSHLNVITAKLKKKSKKGLTKSFIPSQKNQNQYSYDNIVQTTTNDRTLKKQINAKSSSILEFNTHFSTDKHIDFKKSSVDCINVGNSSNNKSNNYFTQNHNYSYKNIDNSYTKNHSSSKPTTPIFFSNRQLLYNQNIAKPFTPQFPLSSSKRINQIAARRQNSKEQINKFFSIQPAAEGTKGIKTTLQFNNQSFQHKARVNNSISIAQECADHQKMEFTSSKKILNSKIMVMRSSNNFQDCRRIVMPNGNNKINERENSTSIFLN